MRSTSWLQIRGPSGNLRLPEIRCPWYGHIGSASSCSASFVQINVKSRYYASQGTRELACAIHFSIQLNVFGIPASASEKHPTAAGAENYLSKPTSTLHIIHCELRVVPLGADWSARTWRLEGAAFTKGGCSLEKPGGLYESTRKETALHYLLR